MWSFEGQRFLRVFFNTQLATTNKCGTCFMKGGSTWSFRTSKFKPCHVLNIQELFLICKPLWFILFRRLSWKKHVWRVAGAWRRVALKLSAVVGSRQKSICDQDGICNTRDRTLSVYFGGSSSKQAVWYSETRTKTGPISLPSKPTSKASWIWFPGSNDFWWSNGQRHRDLRGVWNPRPSADASTTHVGGSDCLLKKNHKKIHRSLQNEHRSSLQEFDLCFGSGSQCWRSTLGVLPEVFCGGRRWVGGYRAEPKSQPKKHRGLWSHFEPSLRSWKALPALYVEHHRFPHAERQACFRLGVKHHLWFHECFHDKWGYNHQIL